MGKISLLNIKIMKKKSIIIKDAYMLLLSTIIDGKRIDVAKGMKPGLTFELF